MSEFIRTVLKWEITDLNNDDLFTLPAQPPVYRSENHWSTSFFPFVLEEIRCSILSGIRKFDGNYVTFHLEPQVIDAARADNAVLSRKAKLAPGNSLDVTSAEALVGCIAIAVQKDRFSRGTRSLGDEIIESRAPHFLLKISGCTFDEDTEDIGSDAMSPSYEVSSMLFRLEFVQCYELSEFLTTGGDGWTVFPLDATSVPGERAMGALECPAFPTGNSLRNEILRAAPTAIEPYSPLSAWQSQESFLSTKIGALINARNESQQNAIYRVLAALNGKETRLQIIHGPPGTGKTATLVALIDSILYNPKHIVYVAAPTNQAICEVARRAVQEIGYGCAAHTASVNMHDMVLLGNRKRLVLTEGAEKIHVGMRVQRIYKANSTIWQASETAIIVKAFPEGVDSASLEEMVLGIEKLRMKCRELSPHFEIIVSEAPAAMLCPSDRDAMRKGLSELDNLEQLLKEGQESLQSFRELSKARELCISLTNTFQETLATLLRQGRKVGPQKENELEKLITEGARLMFSTVDTAGSQRFAPLRSKATVAIIDEATQLVEASTAIMLSSKLECLVLAGDDKQLPATVLSQKAKDAGFDRSLFDRAVTNGFPSSLLSIQYRMHPAISAWPNRKFYEGRIEDGDNVKDPNYGQKFWHRSFPPLTLLNVKGDEKETEFLSYVNYLEVEVVVGVVEALSKLFDDACKDDGIHDNAQSLRVGVITPYAGQQALLVNALKDFNVNDDNTKDLKEEFSVVCRTVDGFQGQECDVIIFVAVRSNDRGNVGFLRDDRRTNVAITRAKHSLIVVADASTLSANSTWRDLFSCFQGYSLTQQSRDIIKEATQRLELQRLRIENLCDPRKAPFEKTLWAGRICFTEPFKKSFMLLKAASRVKVIDKLLMLAKGKWPRSITHRTNSSVAAAVSVAETPTASATDDVLLDGILYCTPMGVEDKVLVWLIDLQEKLVEGSAGKQREFSQVMKFWDLVRPIDITTLRRRIAKAMRTYSTAYHQRCRDRNPDLGPKTWAHDASFTKFLAVEKNAMKLSAEMVQEDAEVGQSCTLMKTFALTSANARVLLSAFKGADLELPHDVSADEEALIISRGSSLFILGRSGTGKTTVMVQRMFRIAVEVDMHRQRFEGEDREVLEAPRQLMVTASPVLAAAIRRHYNAFMHTYTRGRREIVKSTDGDVVDSLAVASQSLELQCVDTSPPQTCVEQLGFHEIPSESYPLILTYNALLAMLNRTVKDPFVPARRAAIASQVVEDPPISYARFRSYYFPRLGDVTAGGRFRVEPAELFKEFISVIKGSLDAVKGAHGRLSLEQYVSLANQRVSNLDAAARDNIYGLFEVYQLERAKQQEFDLADYVGHLYRSLSQTPYAGPLLHTVYVDEVQDLTPAQLALLKFVCGDLNGFVFAGDTAQTIAHGVGFRFETLKALFYSEFIGNTSDAKVPNVQQLKVNFRTHSEVLNLANTVVRLLLHFFPQSVDKLEDETSSLMGPKPIFLADTNDVILELFDRGDMNCDFGSEQAILVRDDEVKQQVKSVCGNKALVLTVLEAKGLEFTDCLLYNVLSCGEVAPMWRVLGGAFEALGLPAEDGKPYTMFSHSKHAVLCTELKRLYVLLTRAKQRLFIFESDYAAREPFIRLWTHARLQVVSLQPFSEDIRTILKSKSSPEDWCARGIEFFSRSNFEAALTCFERGGDHKNELISRAHLLASQADTLGTTNFKAATEKFLEAARIFLAPPVEDRTAAARHFEKGGDYVQAGDIYYEAGDWSLAARNFERAKVWEKAADAHALCQNLSAALKACEQGALFSHGLHIVRNMRGETSSEFAAWVRRSADYYTSKQDVAKLSEFISYCGTEEKRKYYRRRRLLSLLIELERSENNFSEVARLCEANGMYKEAAESYKEMGLLLKAATCLTRAQRLAQLDDVLALKGPANVCDGPSLSTVIDLYSTSTPPNQDRLQWAMLQAEAKLLESAAAKKVKLDTFVEWKNLVKDTSAPQRLLLMVVRSVLAGVDTQRMNLAVVGKKQAQNRKNAPAKADVTKEASVDWPSWESLREAVHSVVQIIDDFKAVLREPMRKFADNRFISPEEKALLYQCFEFFEVRVDSSAARPTLILEDIPAVLKLWPIPATAAGSSAAKLLQSQPASLHNSRARSAASASTGKDSTAAAAAVGMLKQRRSVDFTAFAVVADDFLTRIATHATSLQHRELKDNLDSCLHDLVFREQFAEFKKLFDVPAIKPADHAIQMRSLAVQQKDHRSRCYALLLDAYHLQGIAILERNVTTLIERRIAEAIIPIMHPLVTLETVQQLRSDEDVKRKLLRELTIVKNRRLTHDDMAHVLLVAALLEPHELDKILHLYRDISIPKEWHALIRAKRLEDEKIRLEQRCGVHSVSYWEAMLGDSIRNDPRILLCTSYQWMLTAMQRLVEDEKKEQTGAPDFVPASKCMFEAVNTGTNYLCTPMSWRSSPLYLNEGCLSPFRCLDLIEQYVAVLVFCCSFEPGFGAALPQSLVDDLFARKSEKNPYASMFLSFQTSTEGPQALFSRRPMHVRRRLLDLVLDLLHCKRAGIWEWLLVSLGRSSTTASHLNCEESLSATIYRLLRMMITLLASYRKGQEQDSYYNSFILKLRDGSSNRTDLSLLSGLPSPIVRGLLSLPPSFDFPKFASLFREMGDPFVFIRIHPDATVSPRVLAAREMSHAYALVADAVDKHRAARTLKIIPVPYDSVPKALQVGTGGSAALSLVTSKTFGMQKPTILKRSVPGATASAPTVVGAEAVVTGPENVTSSVASGVSGGGGGSNRFAGLEEDEEEEDNEREENDEEGKGDADNSDNVPPPPPPQIRIALKGVMTILWVEKRLLSLAQSARVRVQNMSPLTRLAGDMKRDFASSCRFSHTDSYVMQYCEMVVPKLLKLQKVKEIIQKLEIAMASDTQNFEDLTKDDIYDVQEDLNGLWEKAMPIYPSHADHDSDVIVKLAQSISQTTEKTMESTCFKAALALHGLKGEELQLED